MHIVDTTEVYIKDKLINYKSNNKKCCLIAYIQLIYYIHSNQHWYHHDFPPHTHTHIPSGNSSVTSYAIISMPSPIYTALPRPFHEPCYHVKVPSVPSDYSGPFLTHIIIWRILSIYICNMWALLPYQSHQPPPLLI